MMKVAGLALPFFGLIFLGYLARRIWWREESALAWLNIFVLYFALPALIAIKLVPHPLIAFFILTWVGGFEPAWIYTGVMMASLPPAAVLYLISNNLLPLDLFAQGYLMRPIFHSSVEPFPTVNAQ